MLTPKNRCWDDKNNPIDSTKGLIDLCKEYINKEMAGVEIGSFAGSSSEVFANFCKSLTCIDPWDLTYQNNNHKMERLNRFKLAEKKFDLMVEKYNNIKKIKSFSMKEYKNFKDKSLDFVYIDGNHKYSYIMDDIFFWKPKIKIGGYLLGHDYNLVFKALNDSKIKINKVFEDSSWVSVIINNFSFRKIKLI